MADEISREKFARALLKEIGAPASKRNLVTLVSWMQAEGSPAKFNPLATTQPMPGSTKFNFASVQNYTSFEQGVEATAKTLRDGAHRAGNPFGYLAIWKRLRGNSYAWLTLRAVERSAWGTGGLARRCRKMVLGSWDHFRNLPIAS